MTNLRPKNYRKLKEEALLKLNELEGDDLYIGKIIEIPKKEIIEGKYQNIGIRMEDGEVKYDKEIMPEKKMGIYSRRNVNGRPITRKDLPKTTKIISREVPNFGDWSKGSHTISYSREVYQKEFCPPKNLTLRVELFDKIQKGGDEYFIFKVCVSEVLQKSSENIEENMLFCINLFRENVGVEDFITSNISYQEYLKSIDITWEILPVGDGDREVLYKKVIGDNEDISEEMGEVILDRYNFLYQLKPESLIKGISGFNRYIGAKFSDDLVVFENLKYGNAVYVMFQNWEELSKLSRVELLKRKHDEFERVIHNKNWKNRVKGIIRCRV